MFFPSLLLSVSFFQRSASSLCGCATLLIHSLSLGEEHVKVILVELLQILLVVAGLTLVKFNDVAELLGAVLEHLNGALEVGLESVVLAVKLHLVEAGKFQFGALQLQLQIRLLVQQLHHLEVDLGSLKEASGPVLEDSELVKGTVLVSLLDSGEVPVDEIERAIGGLHSAHLGVKLVKVLEEELDVDGLGVGLVAEDADKDLQHLNKILRRFVLESLVHFGDSLSGHALQVSLSAFLKGGRLLVGSSLLVDLALLLFDLSSELIDSDSLLLGGSLVIQSLLVVVLLLLSLGCGLLLDLGEGGLGVVPIAGLELASLVEGHLALVTLLDDEVLQLCGAELLEPSLDVYREQTQMIINGVYSVVRTFPANYWSSSLA